MVKITEKGACSGCSACVAVCPKKCITMQPDSMGFLYPVVDIESCIHCGLCETVCTIKSNVATANTDTPKAYAVVGKDDNIRKRSSSGGAFFLLAAYILSRGGVVFGATFDDTFHSVRHVAVSMMDDLKKLQSSKYLQSKMGAVYTEVKVFLEEGRMVLFTGTPCQVDGLRAFLKKDYDNLFLQDIVCHGVPAPAVWDAYLGSLERKYGAKAKSVSFREKIPGWKNYSFSVDFGNGKVFSQKSAENPYMRVFLRDYDLRPSCYQCMHKGSERNADITLADLWGAEHICPTLDDNKGTSLVVIHSPKGKKLFENIEQDIVFHTIELKTAIQFNSSMICAAKDNETRKQFEKHFQKMEIEKLLKKYVGISIWKKLLRKCKALTKSK